MALCQCDFFAESLGLCTSMYVILPQAARGQIGQPGVAGNGPHKTLWLLHGMSDDHSIWLRRTSLERYVASLGIAVVMPRVERSFYTNMYHGARYWDFISEELPALARSFFPLSAEREDNFVAGLSMGGYGAFKLALGCPDKFAVGASLSGALLIPKRLEHLPDDRSAEWLRIFGPPETVEGSENDLVKLATDLVNSDGPRPRLYQWCGTDDFLYPQHTEFQQVAAEIGLEVTTEEGPGGHSWDRWDRQIQRVLEWLEL